VWHRSRLAVHQLVTSPSGWHLMHLCRVYCHMGHHGLAAAGGLTPHHIILAVHPKHSSQNAVQTREL
jgi:hypothetical protein